MVIYFLVFSWKGSSKSFEELDF